MISALEGNPKTVEIHVKDLAVEFPLPQIRAGLDDQAAALEEGFGGGYFFFLDLVLSQRNLVRWVNSGQPA